VTRVSNLRSEGWGFDPPGGLIGFLFVALKGYTSRLKIEVESSTLAMAYQTIFTGSSQESVFWACARHLEFEMFTADVLDSTPHVTRISLYSPKQPPSCVTARQKRFI
jgi:hypothetical protein